MPTIPGASWKDDPIGFLVGQKFPFPPSAFFKAFGAGHTGGAHPPSDPAGGNSADILAAMQAYRETLRALPRSELDALVMVARAEADERFRLQREEKERNRPYNQHHATNPDYGAWTQHAYWTVDEMVGLSLGREPSLVKWIDIQKVKVESPFARRYADRREIINRAVAMGQLWKETIPWVFLAWAERMRVEVPAGLSEAVKSLGLQVRDWKSVSEALQKTVDQLQKELTRKQAESITDLKDHTAFVAKMRNDHQELYDGLNGLLDRRTRDNEALTAKLQTLEAKRPRHSTTLGQRERESLLRIIIGMAVKKYNFKRVALRNPATGRIASDLQEVGLPLDEDTIRKYLAEAKELLSDGLTEGD